MILMADRSELQCTEQGICTMRLTDTTVKSRMVLLPRVLLIPHLERRLFSVPSFISVNNNTVTFSHGKLELHYSGFTSDIGIPARIKTTALPALTHHVEPISTTNLVLANSSPTLPIVRVPTEILHQRLGTQNAPILLASKHSLWSDTKATLSGDGFCTNCIVAILPFKNNPCTPMTIPNSKYKWVSMDVQNNPMPSNLINGYKHKYLQCIVDIYLHRI